MGPREFTLKCSLVEVLAGAAEVTDFALFTPLIAGMLESGCASHKKVTLLLTNPIKVFRCYCGVTDSQSLSQKLLVKW